MGGFDWTSAIEEDLMNDHENYVREYKDTVFKIVFQEKEELLALYNALSGKHYTNPDDLVINTLKDAVFIGMKNDLSFLIDGHLNLFEQQSTYSPNMPLRGFLYVGDLYKEMLTNWRQLYSSKLIKLPMPHFTVFYNGPEDAADYYEERLSTAFYHSGESNETPDLEFIVHVYNINAGHNAELMSKCEKLREYAQFVETVRSCLVNRRGLSKETAFRSAVDMCIENGILTDILQKERARIMTSILGEFDMDEYKEFIKEEYKQIYSEEGREEGREEEKQRYLLELIDCVKVGKLDETVASELAHMSPEAFRRVMQK